MTDITDQIKIIKQIRSVLTMTNSSQPEWITAKNGVRYAFYMGAGEHVLSASPFCVLRENLEYLRDGTPGPGYTELCKWVDEVVYNNCGGSNSL